MNLRNSSKKNEIKSEKNKQIKKELKKSVKKEIKEDKNDAKKNKETKSKSKSATKKNYIPKKEEKLVKYEIKEEDNNKYLNQKLEDENDDENWDQFELNKKMYNVVSTYDENLYTTKLDKNKISEEDKIYADKIYKEIMGANNKEKNVYDSEDGLDEKKREYNREGKSKVKIECGCNYIGKNINFFLLIFFIFCFL